MESDDEDIMTAEQKERYLQQVHESEGFEVEHFPGINYHCKIRPLVYLDVQPILKEEVKSCSEWAIRKFNSDNVLKANAMFCGCEEFYLTFTAKDDVVDADGDQSPVIFQAKVCAPICGEKEYCFCRPKLKS